MGRMNEVPEALLMGDDFREYMEATETQAKVIPATAYRDALIKRMFSQNSEQFPTLPWAKTMDKIHFRPGEVSLWAGANGSGKSMILGNASLGWMRARQGVALASFEMKPLTQLERYARQFTKGASPTAQAIDGMFDWMTGRLWFYDQQGTVKPEMVFAVARYAADKLKAKHFIVDSLMKCVRGEDDYNGQKDFVDEITSIARDTGLHIHLVHHIKKPSDESTLPTKYDAKGSGSITDQVDNVFMFWRNKPKEAVQDKSDRGDRLSASEEEKLTAPDAILACDKQRNGEWEGRVALWFHKGAQQYCADPKRQLVDFT